MVRMRHSSVGADERVGADSDRMRVEEVIGGSICMTSWEVSSVVILSHNFYLQCVLFLFLCPRQKDCWQ